jgi:hypothetical protein
MSSLKTIIGVLLLTIAIILAVVGASLMFFIVPAQVDNAEFPEDFDDYFTYGGVMKKVNLTNGRMDTENFTVERHIQAEDKLDNGHLIVDETITAYRNGTDWSETIGDLNSENIYEIHPKDIILYRVEQDGVVEKTYTEDQDVHWVFPIPVEKKDYKVYNLNIMNYSDAKYQYTEDVEGVECYVFYGEENEYPIPNPDILAESLPEDILATTTTTLNVWEKAWVHPLTGTIVDYAKEVRQFIHLGDLPEIPRVVYPSDLNSTTEFHGTAILFDPSTGTFNEIGDLEVEMCLSPMKRPQ